MVQLEIILTEKQSYNYMLLEWTMYSSVFNLWLINWLYGRIFKNTGLYPGYVLHAVWYFNPTFKIHLFHYIFYKQCNHNYPILIKLCM